MTVRITFKSGKIEEIIKATHFEFPKVKTIKINLENGLSYCFYTKSISRINIIG